MSGQTCSAGSIAAGEAVAGSATEARVWVVVEHLAGWGDAGLARSGGGVRIVLARGGGRHGPGRRQTGSAPARVWVARAGDPTSLRLGSVDAPGDVAAWDLHDIAAGSLAGFGAPCVDPLLLICGNGRRDPCCGLAGGRLAGRLCAGPVAGPAQGPADGPSDGPLAGTVLTCTHLGGHRFAPTGLVLPAAAMHGRLTDQSAAALLPMARLGRTPLATLRGFTSMTPAGQVAEAHVRGLTGYRGLVPLSADADPMADDGTVTVHVGSPDLLGSLAVRLRPVSWDIATSCGSQREVVGGWAVADG